MKNFISEHFLKTYFSVLFFLLLGTLTVPQLAVAASLTVSQANAPATVDLSANSPADWIHWGYKALELDRKAGVTPQISDYTHVNGADPGAYDNVSAGYSWTDGIAPGGAIAGTHTGERVFQVGKGFQFIVPANTTLKTLRVYVGSSGSNGQLTATLSDGSAPAYNVAINQGSGSSSREVTLNFRAASGGQTLTVRYVVTARNTANSFITLESAALDNIGGGGGATLTGSMVNISNVNLTAKGPTDWIHWGRISDQPSNRKSGIAPLISEMGTVGHDVTPAIGATDTQYSWNDGRPNSSVSTSAGLRLFAADKGFRFTAPADTNTRTLKVFVGLNNAARARFTASLSDGSAPNYSTTISQNSGRNTTEFTITYQAASAGKQITITYVREDARTNGTWITLEAAKLLGSGGGGGGTQPPGSAPSNVSASDDTFTNKVGVTWNSVNGATYYEVYRSTSAGTNGSLRASPAGTAYDDTNATAGTTYYYSVKACNSAGCSGFSAQDAGSRAVAVVAPGVPTGIAASDDTFTTKVEVNWNTVSGATGYEVYRSTTSGVAGSLIASPTTNTYDDTSAVADISYYYSLKACNSAGCSGFSTQDVGSRAVDTGGGGTPPANPPRDITASVDSFTDKVAVSWGAVTDASYYELWRSETDGLKGTQLGLPTATSFDDTTATPGTDYYYGLKACNDAGCSAFSGQSLGRMGITAAPPATPANVNASDNTFTDKITLSWNAVTDATSYEIYRSMTSGNIGNLIASPSAASFDDTSATAGVTYFYSIKACNGAGCSGFSAQDQGTRATPATPPAVPSNVNASDDTFTDKIAVTWNAVNGAASYEVYRSTNAANNGSLIASPGAANYDDTSASIGTTYYYRIKACNADGCSGFSAQDQGSRATVAGTPPANPPKDITASVDSFTDKVAVSWGAVTDASYYELWRSETAGLKGTQLGLPTATSFDDTTATPGTDYYYGLIACNDAGCSGFSGQSLGRMGITVAPPATPANVNASDNTFTDKITLSWNAVTDATSYEIYRSMTSGNIGNLIASPSAASFDDTSATAGVTYFYSIKACNGAGCSGFSAQDQGTRATPATPPLVIAPGDTTVDSTGAFTAVDLGLATATDSIDGELTPTADNTGPFAPGRHTITWSATNSAGLTGTAQQTVDVQPQVDVQLDQAAGEGGTATVSVYLSGPAAVYPVTIPYTVSGSATNPDDHDAADAGLVIDSGTVGEISFSVNDDAMADPNETVIFTLGTPVNAVTGSNTTHTTTIIEDNLAPTVSLSTTQGGITSNWIASDGGNVVINSTVNDANPGDLHLYNWSLSDNTLIPLNGFTADSFSFDPTTLTEGHYIVRLTVEDSGIPAMATSVELMLTVVATRAALSDTSDSDYDGMDDASEGYNDSDGDGIADYLDAINNPALLPGNETNNTIYQLQVSAGLSVSLGQTATASGLSVAAVTEQNLAENGGSGGSVGVNTGDDNYNYPVGIFDFEIGNLPVVGQSVAIVIPTLGALPDGATYRKYRQGMGWQDFVEDINNLIASAPGTAGNCPPPGDSSYTPGLTAGHHCIQVTIEDGGPNDADSMANAIVRDPGAVADAIEQNNSPAQPSGGGGGCTINPDARLDLTFYLVLFLAITYRSFSRRNKNAR